MKKLKFHLAVVSLVFFCACSSPEKAIVPLNPDPQLEDTYTIIWNGISNAYRYTDGNWKRDETYDYVFNVTQKRYHQQWTSTKCLHRLCFRGRYFGSACMLLYNQNGCGMWIVDNPRWQPPADKLQMHVSPLA